MKGKLQKDIKKKKKVTTIFQSMNKTMYLTRNIGTINAIIFGRIIGTEIKSI